MPYSTLTSLNTQLCLPWITRVQFHGSFLPCILLGTLWILAGFARLRELRRLKNLAQKRSFRNNRPQRVPSATNLASEEATALPAVTVILPTRGCRPHSLDNWRSFLAMHYSGPLEFLFVLESPSDPASAAIATLLKETMSSRRQARMVCSGHAETTSQKIHNLIAGIKSSSPAAQYILCLDDDVQLHPAALLSLIDNMEMKPDAKVATGYPFDIPPLDANLLTYCVLCYHLPLVVGFSVNQEIDFVWGGCMLFRAEDLRNDTLKVLSSWADGGYSDDLTVASACVQAGEKVLCPSHAIFPQWLEDSVTIERYWNYLRRQLYVLDTYATPSNRRTNHFMAAFHVYASLAFVVPVTTTVVRLLVWIATLIVLPMQSVHGGVGSEAYSWLDALVGGGGGGGRDDNKKNNENCDGAAVWSLVLFLCSWAYMALALRWLTGVILELFRELNPALRRRKLDTFDWLKLWMAFYISNAVLPVCMVYTFVTRHIDWAGIRYYRDNGKVVRVDHAYVKSSSSKSDSGSGGIDSGKKSGGGGEK